ncbi:hypothetical protein EAO71_27385 [Streptomyces sp. ms191]|nr:hypothetical protein EAO71_27385 [Streptomyces sp. ms191]
MGVAGIAVIQCETSPRIVVRGAVPEVRGSLDRPFDQLRHFTSGQALIDIEDLLTVSISQPRLSVVRHA